MRAARPPGLVLLCLVAGCGCGSADDARDAGAPVVAPAARGAPLTSAGQPGRRVLSGGWRFRLASAKRWRAVTLPYDWNGREAWLNRADVGIFRRTLVLPRRRGVTAWVLRFEGAGHRATVYANGHRLASHRGNYLPFEAVLRPGRNRITVRVSSLRTADDLTHWRRARFHRYGQGWWNFGGIHREVTLRPVRTLDVARAQGLVRIACPTCPARVTVRALVRNLGGRSLTPRVTATAASRTIALRTGAIAPGGAREAVGTLTIDHPRLWDLGRGNLYDLRVRAGAASYRTWFGVRDLHETADGLVYLNGRRLFARGISLHEDSPAVGSAYRRAQLDRVLDEVRALHATVVRSHYPLNPSLIEQLDRRGILVWDEAPVNLVQNAHWAKRAVRRAAVRASAEMVLRDRGHPSVLAYSVADELPIPVHEPQRAFLRAAAARVRALDPTTMVAVDRVARYGAPDDADPVWGTFDALGVNEYFGWYRGALPPRPPAKEDRLPSYYATLHREQPHAALFVTEFGAEANRGGPVTEKGTWAYQARYLRRHIAIAERTPFVNGAMVWALRDFRVHSGWDGGNPRPHPPYNQKGLISIGGRVKPGFRAVEEAFAGQ